MEIFHYPETAEHRITHDNFLIKLDEILNISTGKSANKEILIFLKEWLTKHVVGADKGYAKFILSGASVVRS